MSEKNATETVFDTLNTNIGKNLVLTILVLSIMCIGYLYLKSSNCEQSQVEQQREFTNQTAKQKDEFIRYLQGVNNEVDKVKKDTEAVEAESENTEKQLKKIKKDLQ